MSDSTCIAFAGNTVTLLRMMIKHALILFSLMPAVCLGMASNPPQLTMTDKLVEKDTRGENTQTKNTNVAAVPDKCVICWDKLRDGKQNVLTLPCHSSHSYHAVCVLKHLKDNETCPACRAKNSSGEIKMVRTNVMNSSDVEDSSSVEDADPIFCCKNNGCVPHDEFPSRRGAFIYGFCYGTCCFPIGCFLAPLLCCIQDCKYPRYRVYVL